MERYRGILFNPSWLLVLMLEFISSSTGLSYAVVPQNVTVSSGQMVTFRCGIVPDNMSQQLNFTVQRPDANYTLTCPGISLNISALSLTGQCDYRSPEITATWHIASATANFNGTPFLCHSQGLVDKYGYLWITASSSYYAMLFGCVMGGFFGILIVFVVSYISLKRSERLQKCFRGPEEDEVTEASKEF